MNFAAIANVGALADERLIDRPVQFCLAQHYLNPYLPKYKEFYDDQVKMGHHVILDNGCWEEKLVSFDELCKAVDLLRPQTVVLPDVMGNAKLTRYLSEAFSSFYSLNACNSPSPWHVNFMYVLHGDDIFDLIHEYRTSPSMFIGLPRRLGHLRLELCQRLHQVHLWDPAKYVHALGMINGNVEELTMLAKLGVHSVDSSNPVWRGGGQREDFDVESTSVLSYIAARNLEEIDRRCPFPKPSTSATQSPSLSDEEVPF